MSSWNGQLCGEEGYFLQFETKNYETYKRVEKLCQDIMDEETGRKTLTEMCKDHFILGADLSIPESCRRCSNHPSNGGSGICNCTLGQYSINKITEYESKDFNLYGEIKQSLEDAIKFESKNKIKEAEINE